MAKISSLFVELSLEAQNFNNGIKDIERQAKEFSKTVAPMQRVAEDIGKTLAAVGGAAVAGFGAMVLASASAGEQLNKFSIQTGISTEQLAGLQLAAEQNETTFEALGIGLKKMSTVAVSNAGAFKDIGVSVRDSSGEMLPMIEILKRTADRFQAMPDGVEKSALAVKLFGKTGADLIPTLNLGRKGLEEMQKSADDLGLSMSGKAAAAADNFKDTLGGIEKATLGLSNAVAESLMPQMQSWAGLFKDLIVGAKNLAKEHETLTSGIFGSAAALTTAGGLLLGFSAIVSIYPKVVIGLNAVGLSISQLGAAAAGATIGIFVGQLVNAAIAGTVLERQLDAVTDSLVTPLKYLGLWADGTALVAEQEKAQAVLLAENRTRLYALGIAYDTAGKSQAQMLDETKKLLVAAQLDTSALKKKEAGIHELTDEEKKAMEIEAKWRAANAAIYAEQVKNALDFVNKWVASFEKTAEEADKTTAAFQRQEVATSKLAYTAVDAQAVITKAMFSTHDVWEHVNEKALASDAHRFDGLNELRETDLDRQFEYLTKRVKIEEEMYDRAIREYHRMGDEFARTFDNMTTAASVAFAGMVVHGKFSMDQFVSIAQDTAQSMLSAFLKGLISPLTNQLTKLGAQLGDVISKSLGIGGGVGSLGLPGIGGVGGGGTGNLLGKGAGSLGLFGLSGAATLGIGAGALAIGLIAKHYIGKGRRTADEFTSGTQAQFGSDLAEVSARGTVADLDQLWAQFNKDANQFASQGGTEQTVVRQAHETLDSLVAQIRADLGRRDAANASNVNITVNPAPSMDTGQLVNEIMRRFQADAALRAEFAGMFA